MKKLPWINHLVRESELSTQAAPPLIEAPPLWMREINPEYALKGLMLKFQYFGHLM